MRGFTNQIRRRLPPRLQPMPLQKGMPLTRKQKLNHNGSEADMEELTALHIIPQISRIYTDYEEFVETIFKPVWCIL
jgi:hypothetical protein